MYNEIPKTVYGVVYQPENGEPWLSQCHHETREYARQAGERILREWPDMAYTIVKFVMEGEK